MVNRRAEKPAIEDYIGDREMPPLDGQQSMWWAISRYPTRPLPIASAVAFVAKRRHVRIQEESSAERCQGLTPEL